QSKPTIRVQSSIGVYCRNIPNGQRGASGPDVLPAGLAPNPLPHGIKFLLSRKPQDISIFARPSGAATMDVVFDIGNVLIRWNPRNLFRKTMRDEARMERFLSGALSMDFVHMTDVAADFAHAVKERAKAFPEFAQELHLFDERWVETIGGPIEENIALLRRLKAAGRPVYGLSNFAAVKFALARRIFGVL